MPIFTRRSRASTFQIVSARLTIECYQDHFCPWYFFSSTHFDLVSLMARKVWRLSRSVFVVHDRYSHARNCTCLPSNIGLFLSTRSKYLFLLQSLLAPFDSWPLLLFQFSRAWCQSFVIVVSDLNSFSPLSSIFDNCASISSDEAPCRAILIRCWIARTHVFSICTDFPMHHRMDFLT